MAFLLPYLLTRISLPYWKPLLKQAVQVNNYRGRQVISLFGLPLAVSLVVTYIFSPLWGVPPAGAVALVQVVIFLGLTGLIDDYFGKGTDPVQARGFAGHLGELLQNGRVTSGLLKLLLISLLGFYLALQQAVSFQDFLSSLLLVPLAANTVNLFDLRPLRAIKAFALFSLPLAGGLEVFWQAYLPIPAVLLPYIPIEAREEGMLGDTGANLLGGLLGYFYLSLASWPVKASLSLLLLLINLSAERISFSCLICENPLLNYLDSLGREGD
ncbi:MAG: hypothetical protein UMV23_00825 [Halanaerobium sp.]|nr:hypothetical protein [Halanaerobium sp.]